MFRGAGQIYWLAEITPIEPEPGNAGVGKKTIRERFCPGTDPWGWGAFYLSSFIFENCTICRRGAAGAGYRAGVGTGSRERKDFDFH